MRTFSRHSRRHFLHRAVVAAGALSLGANRPYAAQTGKARLRFAVLGINHEHIFRMVQAIRDGGGELAMIFADEPDPIHGAKFLRQHADVRRARTERELLDAPNIALVVSAARPAERTSIGLRVMQAGKDFLADKGGFLNLEDLAAARRVQAATGRRYPARSVHVWWTTYSIVRKPLSLRNKPSWPANSPCTLNSLPCERAPSLPRSNRSPRCDGLPTLPLSNPRATRRGARAG